MTKEERDKMLIYLEEQINYDIAECRLRIAKEEGRIDGLRMATEQIAHYVRGQSESEDAQPKQTDKSCLDFNGVGLGDEVVGDYGAKGVVVGIDTYNGEVLLSLLMRNHKVPQLVKASNYKTKTGRHFPQILEVLEQITESEEK